MNKWSVSDISEALPALFNLEFEDNDGEWHHFTVMATPKRIVFGGVCNTGFVESGYLEREECDNLDESFQELQADLESYYNDGPEYVSRIVCNNRM